ncbi:MAG: hydroxymyristoyl-ACP dehydratase [Rikenellaceae bacterium]
MGVSTKAIISNEEILEFIPQRAPIVMVDEFFGVDDNLSVSALKITEDNIFCEDGLLGECGIIEHIAQGAALRMGYIYKSAGKAVPIGFIGSVNRFEIFGSPKVGQKIITELRVEQELMNISLVSAQVSCCGEQVARCSMKIFLQE